MKYKLISSIVSLTMCAVLFICVCFAWYTNNTQVEADGVHGVTSEGDIRNVQLTRYIAVESNNTYTKKTLNQAEIKPYDSLEQYTKIIYEITFTTTLELEEIKSSLQLSIRNTSTSRTDSFKPKTIGENTYQYNYLSNVAVFKELECNNGVYTILDPVNSATIPYSGKEDTTTHLVSFNPVTTILKSNENVVSLALLFDYNIENINQLYTSNLGSTSNVRFEDDIEFLLKILKR